MVATEPYDEDVPAELHREEPRPCLTFDEIASNQRIELKSPAPSWGWLEREWRGHPPGVLLVRDFDRLHVLYAYRRDNPDLFAIA